MSYLDIVRKRNDKDPAEKAEQAEPAVPKAWQWQSRQNAHDQARSAPAHQGASAPESEYETAAQWVLENIRMHLPARMRNLSNEDLATLVLWSLGIAAKRSVAAGILLAPEDFPPDPPEQPEQPGQPGAPKRNVIGHAIGSIIGALAQLSNIQTWRYVPLERVDVDQVDETGHGQGP